MAARKKAKLRQKRREALRSASGSGRWKGILRASPERNAKRRQRSTSNSKNDQIISQISNVDHETPFLPKIRNFVEFWLPESNLDFWSQFTSIAQTNRSSVDGNDQYIKIQTGRQRKGLQNTTQKKLKRRPVNELSTAKKSRRRKNPSQDSNSSGRSTISNSRTTKKKHKSARQRKIEKFVKMMLQDKSKPPAPNNPHQYQVNELLFPDRSQDDCDVNDTILKPPLAYSKSTRHVPKHAGKVKDLPYGVYERNRVFRNGVSKKLTEGYVSRCGKNFLMTPKQRLEGLRIEVNNLIDNKKRFEAEKEEYLYQDTGLTGFPHETGVWDGLYNKDSAMASIVDESAIPIKRKRPKKIRHVSPSKDLLFSKKTGDQSGTMGKRYRKRWARREAPARSAEINLRLSLNPPMFRTTRRNEADIGLELGALRARKSAKVSTRSNRTDAPHVALKQALKKLQAMAGPEGDGEGPVGDYDVYERERVVEQRVYYSPGKQPSPKKADKSVNYLELERPDFRYSDLNLNMRKGEVSYENRLRDQMVAKKSLRHPSPKKRSRSRSRSASRSRSRGSPVKRPRVVKISARPVELSPGLMDQYGQQAEDLDDLQDHLTQQDLDDELEALQKERKRKLARLRRLMKSHQSEKVKEEIDALTNHFEPVEGQGGVDDRIGGIEGRLDY